jgi:hypothetical protein
MRLFIAGLELVLLDVGPQLLTILGRGQRGRDHDCGRAALGSQRLLNAAFGVRFLAGAFFAASSPEAFLRRSFFARAFFAGAFLAGAFFAGAFFAAAFLREPSSPALSSPLSFAVAMIDFLLEVDEHQWKLLITGTRMLMEKNYLFPSGNEGFSLGAVVFFIRRAEAVFPLKIRKTPDQDHARRPAIRRR